MQYNVFICHASEDKDTFVRPFANALRAEGLAVWYDEFTLVVGDSIRRKIEQGLQQSSFGVVVLSPAFFRKEWSQRELDALFAKEIDDVRVILPIWHDLGVAEIRQHSVLLADRLAVSSTLGVDAVAAVIAGTIRDSERSLVSRPAIPSEPAETVEIVLSRPPRLIGMSVSFTVRLDGEDVGYLAPGSDFRFKTTAGRHALKVKYRVWSSGGRSPSGVGGYSGGETPERWYDFTPGTWSFKCDFKSVFGAFMLGDLYLELQTRPPRPQG
jgi:hypothetical protein